MGIQFFRNWKKRHNPISLAIFTMILFVMFFAVGSGVFIVLLREDVRAIVGTFLIIQSIVCVIFHISFTRAAKRFDGKREK